jgi:cardiolipin synthase
MIENADRKQEGNTVKQQKDTVIGQYVSWISGLLTKKEIFTIPNLLSVFRLVLAALFLVICWKCGGIKENWVLLTGILILSAITDLLDGKIARKFNMVSELGKILDPIADKVTQGVLLICLSSEYKLTRALLLLFLVKESYMIIMGARMVVKTQANDGAKWYGKVNTTVFYIVMAILIIFPDLPKTVVNLLILCSGVFMALTFAMYARYYRKMLRA